MHPGEYEVILAEAPRRQRAARARAPTPKSAEVLTELRDARPAPRGVLELGLGPRAQAIAEAGLDDRVDLLVSSAWAGARKPHPRSSAHTLDQLGVGADEVVFVGDTWGPDVDGPRALGMTPLYLVRDDHWPDTTAPASPIGTTDDTDGGM